MFQFLEEEDIEIETFFGSTFGGNRYYHWSFINEEPQWRNSSNYSNSRQWSWRNQYSDYDESTDSENSESDLSSERLTLGLNAFGPLNLEDIKNAWVFNEFPARKNYFVMCFYILIGEVMSMSLIAHALHLQISCVCTEMAS